MPQDTTVFRYLGKYDTSSAIRTIVVDGKEMDRAEYRKQLVSHTINSLPKTPEGETPLYIATGGGYGSFNELLTYEKSQGRIADNIPSIKGNDYRDLAPFMNEREAVNAAIAAHLGDDVVKGNPQAVEQTRSAFYSHEVNTLIGKEVVNEAIKTKHSSAYESASIYEDTVQRALAAGMNGLGTVLIAGDKKLEDAIADLPNIHPANTATSYKKFSARFEGELVPLFDEIRLYNTDGEQPKLIAQKSGKGQQLEVLDSELYQQFLAKKDTSIAQYEDKAADANIILKDHKEREEQKAAGQQGISVPTTPKSPLDKPKER